MTIGTLLTVDQVAKALAVNADTVRRMCGRRDIQPAYKIAGAWRVPAFAKVKAGAAFFELKELMTP